MRTLSTPEMLSVWERTYGRSATYKALALLAAACPESRPDELARLSLGERDGLLLALRESLFGPELSAVSVCPNCGDRIELSLSVGEFRDAIAAGGERQLGREEPGDGGTVGSDGYRVRFRLPNSLDLVAIESVSDPEEARDRLLQRCVVSVERERARGPESGRSQSEADPARQGSERSGNWEHVDPSSLPRGVLARVADGIEQACSPADFSLDVDCHECGHRWETGIDMAGYLTQEIDAWAQRVIREVHALAVVYGWSEAEILAMSPARRQAYLDLAGHR